MNEWVDMNEWVKVLWGPETELVHFRLEGETAVMRKSRSCDFWDHIFILNVWSQLGWKELTHFPWRSRLGIIQPGKWWEQVPRKGQAQERNRRQKDMATWTNVRKHWKCRLGRDCMRTSGQITSQLSNHWGLWWCSHSTQGILSRQSRTTGTKSPKDVWLTVRSKWSPLNLCNTASS